MKKLLFALVICLFLTACFSALAVDVPSSLDVTIPVTWNDAVALTVEGKEVIDNARFAYKHVYFPIEGYRSGLTCTYEASTGKFSSSEMYFSLPSPSYTNSIFCFAACQYDLDGKMIDYVVYELPMINGNIGNEQMATTFTMDGTLSSIAMSTGNRQYYYYPSSKTWQNAAGTVISTANLPFDSQKVLDSVKNYKVKVVDPSEITAVSPATPTPVKSEPAVTQAPAEAEEASEKTEEITEETEETAEENPIDEVWTCINCGTRSAGSVCPDCGAEPNQWQCINCSAWNDGDVCVSCNFITRQYCIVSRILQYDDAGEAERVEALRAVLAAMQ